MKYQKLSDYAKERSVCYKTAWNRFKLGLIKGAYKDECGQILVPIQSETKEVYATYARVSSSENKDNLIRQNERLLAYINTNNLSLYKQFKEVGSGMNDNRKELQSLLKDNNWNVLLVENKDRLTLFGFNYISTLLELLGKRIVVINEIENDKESLMTDLVSIIYSFSARMYGLRRKKNKQEIISFLENDNIS